MIRGVEKVWFLSMWRVMITARTDSSPQMVGHKYSCVPVLADVENSIDTSTRVCHAGKGLVKLLGCTQEQCCVRRNFGLSGGAAWPGFLLSMFIVLSARSEILPYLFMLELVAKSRCVDPCRRQFCGAIGAIHAHTSHAKGLPITHQRSLKVA